MINYIPFDVILIYIGIAMLSYITPGPDWLIISKNTMKGKMNGLITAIGVQSGLLFHMIIGALGATAILASSKVAFEILQLAGAIYIIWLGYHALQDALDASKNPNSNDSLPPTRISSFMTGFMANILNPKAALFFISILPQFIIQGKPLKIQVFTLGIIDILAGVIWWIFFVIMINKLNKVTEKKETKNRIELITGSLLTIIGLVLIIRSGVKLYMLYF